MASIAIPVLEWKEVPSQRKKFTRSELERLEATGLFDGQRLELLNGDLIDKMGHNPPHADGIVELTYLLNQIFRNGRVRVQVPIELPEPDANWNQPQPDLAVTPAGKRYSKGHPAGSDLLLAVEVADSSVRQDTGLKRLLYARAGVPEYWVLDIPSRKLLVYRKPEGGEFQEAVELSDAEFVPYSSNAGVPSLVRDLLP